MLVLVLFLCPALTVGEWVKVYPLEYPTQDRATPLPTIVSKITSFAPNIQTTDVRIISTKFQVVNVNKTQDQSRMDTKEKPNQKRKEHHHHPKKIVKKSQPFGLDSVISFVKSIRNSLFIKAGTQIKEKINFLENFRDKLLSEIDTRIKLIWPAKTKESTPRRTKRHMSGGGHEHEFPSSEGALMTISFLTFAVFLIKLVLQVIHTIKSKHYTINGMDPTQIGTVRVVKKNINARRMSFGRDSSDVYDYINVMKSIHR